MSVIQLMMIPNIIDLHAGMAGCDVNVNVCKDMDMDMDITKDDTMDTQRWVKQLHNNLA